MTDVSTPAKGLIQQTIGSNTNNWGRILNSTLSMIDTALGGTLTKTLSDDIMLTESDIANTGFRFTGVLPSPVTVTFPHFNGMAVISNDTNQTLNCGFVGKYVVVPAGTTSSFWSDGSVFETMASDFASRYITLIPASPPDVPLPTFYFEAKPGTQFELASTTLNSNSGDCGDIKITPGVGLTKNGRVISRLPAAIAGSGIKGGGFDFEAGQGDGAAEGGTVYLQGGFGGASGNGGPVFFQAGDGGSTDGNGGLAGLQGGAATSPNGVGGNIVLVSGASNGTDGVGGEILVRTGGSSAINGTSGDLKLVTGQGHMTGQVSITSGDADTVSGDVDITTGAALNGFSGSFWAASGPVTDGYSGSSYLESGELTGTGSTGTVGLGSGTVNGTGPSGNVLIYSGNTPNTSGDLQLTTGNGDITGQVLVKTGDAGSNSGSFGVESGTVTDGTSGAVYIESGGATGNGSTGNAGLGSGGAGTGTSGTVYVYTGNMSGGTSGNCMLRTGIGGISGVISIKSGLANTTSGAVDLSSGNIFDSGETGLIEIYSGNNLGTGNSGAVYVRSGSAEVGASGRLMILTGDSASQQSGEMTIATGSTPLHGDTGDMKLRTGNATDGNSGNVVITTGTASTKSGDITLQTGTGGDIFLTPGSGNAVKPGDVAFQGKVGFNTHVPIVKPTVTGSRASGAALQSLITALASYGLVIDSTSA